MTEECTVIEVELCVEADDIVFFGDDERVDFDLAAILANESIIELHERSSGLANCRLRNINRIGHARSLEGCETDGWIDRIRDDLFRGLSRNILNRRTAFGGTHHDNTTLRTVNDEGEIVFLLDVGTGFDEKTANLLAFRTRLLRNECLTEKSLCILLDVSRVLCQHDTVHAFIALDRALAAAASMDLRLDDNDLAAEFLSVLHSLFDRESRFSLRDVYAVLAQDCLALVLMDIHESAPLCNG